MENDSTAEETVSLTIDHGALTEVPVWESHTRNRNWAATLVNVDPRKPGGFERKFWQRAQGEHFYIVPPLVPGTAVEFGADYYTSSGAVRPCRWYGVVTMVDTTAIVFTPHPSAREAIDEGEALLTQRQQPRPTRLDEVNAEILTLLNSTNVERGMRWYAERKKLGTVSHNRGKLEDWRFRLLTDAAAREAGLLNDSK